MQIIIDIFTYYTVYEVLLQDLRRYFHVSLKNLFLGINVLRWVLKPNCEAYDWHTNVEKISKWASITSLSFSNINNINQL